MEPAETPTTTEAQSASPPKSPRKKRGKIPAESATVRELRKWYVYQKATGLYNGIRERSDLIRSVADKVGEKFKDIGQTVIETDLGKTADDILGDGVRRIKAATARVSSPMPKIRESVDKTKKRIISGAIRYSPPVLFARWSVDLALSVSCFILATMRDVYRLTNRNMDIFEKEPNDFVPIYPTRDFCTCFAEARENLEDIDGSPASQRESSAAEVVPPAVGRENQIVEENRAAIGNKASLENQVESTQEESGAEENEALDENGDVQTTDENKSLAECIDQFMEEHSLLGSFIKNLLITIRIILQMALAIMIPIMMQVTFMLYHLRKKVFKISGGFAFETPEECRERQEMFVRLIAHGKPLEELRPLGPDEWLLDQVVDNHVGCLMKWMIIGRIIGFFVTRPVRIFGNKMVLIKKILNAKDVTADYLKEDPNYDEDKDPDYQPNDGDVLDDSLEYKDDDELEPDDQVGEVSLDAA